MSVYSAYKNSRILEHKTDHVKVYTFSDNGTDYRVIETKRKGNRHTVIRCQDNMVYWEQYPLLPRLSGYVFIDKAPIYAVSHDKLHETIFVVKGNPNAITGLDSGIFGSARNYNPDRINVMSWQRFMMM